MTTPPRRRLTALCLGAGVLLLGGCMIEGDLHLRGGHDYGGRAMYEVDGCGNGADYTMLVALAIYGGVELFRAIFNCD